MKTNNTVCSTIYGNTAITSRSNLVCVYVYVWVSVCVLCEISLDLFCFCVFCVSVLCLFIAFLFLTIFIWFLTYLSYNFAFLPFSLPLWVHTQHTEKLSRFTIVLCVLSTQVKTLFLLFIFNLPTKITITLIIIISSLSVFALHLNPILFRFLIVLHPAS